MCKDSNSKRGKKDRLERGVLKGSITAKGTNRRFCPGGQRWKVTKNSLPVSPGKNSPPKACTFSPALLVNPAVFFLILPT